MARKPPTEKQIKDYLALVRQGKNYIDAWSIVFPHRKVGKRSRSAMGSKLYHDNIERFESDILKLLSLHDLDHDRYGKELDERLQATTLKDTVASKIVDDDNGCGHVVTLRNTIEVEDNRTRMDATKELGLATGVTNRRGEQGPAPGLLQLNVVVPVVLSKEEWKQKAPQRIEDLRKGIGFPLTNKD